MDQATLCSALFPGVLATHADNISAKAKKPIFAQESPMGNIITSKFYLKEHWWQKIHEVINSHLMKLFCNSFHVFFTTSSSTLVFYDTIINSNAS